MLRQAPGPEMAFSKVLLTELLNSRHTKQAHAAAAGSEEILGNSSTAIIDDLTRSPAPLPTREAARNLTKAYFRFANFSMPLLHAPTFQKKVDTLYDTPPLSNISDPDTGKDVQWAVFFVFEVFAVALIVMQKHQPSKIPTSYADGYHKTALMALNEAGLPSGLEAIQALLLIGQYSYHHPTIWAVWKTVGAALRLAVEQGLHKDPSSVEHNALTVDTMRRTFWVAYVMDRNISFALGLPSCLSDGAITTEFPSEVGDEYITLSGIKETDTTFSFSKQISNHLIRFRQIQSELQVVLNEKRPPTYVLSDIGEWQRSMHDRIQKWYEAIPVADNLPNLERKSLEAFELTLHRALFYLYHPSLNIPTPSDTASLALADAATHMIRLYSRFFRDHRLTVYWQAVENLYSAGNALLFTYVNSSLVRERLALHTVETLVHTCSSVLWGMVEHFPDFQGRRDAFDLTATKVLADINSNTLAMVTASKSHMQGTGLINEDHIQSFTENHTSLLPAAEDQSLAESRKATTPRASMADHSLRDESVLPTEFDVSAEHLTTEMFLGSVPDNEVDWSGFNKFDDFLAPGWM